MQDFGNWENYKCISIAECDQRLIDRFWISEDKDAEGLVYYLRSPDGAKLEEEDDTARTYVVIDTVMDCIVGYFTLRAGQCHLNVGSFFRRKYKVLPGIELAMLAVNDCYREICNPVSFSFGEMIYKKFAVPKIEAVSKLVGVKVVYIFALPYKPSLVNFYKKLGFVNPNYASGNKRRIHTMTPAFDSGCVFMFQTL